MVVEQYTAATTTDKNANEQDNLMESKPEPAAGGYGYNNCSRRTRQTVTCDVATTAAVLLVMLPGLSAMCYRICSSLFTVRVTYVSRG
jgi:hypothetical protein